MPDLSLISHTASHCLRLYRKQYGRFSSRYQTNWVLLIGTDYSGKSTLLSHASLALTPLLAHESGCQWWQTNHTSFIDSSLTAEDLPPLLNSLKKAKPHAPLDRIILMLDVVSITQNTQDSIARLGQQLTLIQKHLGEHIPVTLVVNKIDLLRGFQDYFDDLDPTDQSRPFGFSLAEKSPDDTFEQHLRKQSNQLLKQISQQLFKRLHYERSATRRTQIQHFPMAFEQLLSPLIQVITALPWQVALPLEGIYFTSATQHDAPTHGATPHPFLLTHESVSSTLDSPMRVLPSPKSNRAFFVDDLLAHMSEKDKSKRHLLSRRITWKRLLALPIAVLLISGTMILWHIDYQHNLNAIKTITAGLQQLSKPSTVNSTPAWLYNTNILANTLSTTKTHTNSALSWLGLNQAQTLLQMTTEDYHHLLKNNFSPFVSNILTKRLQQALDSHSLHLYSDLKAYLMLTTPKHFHKADLLAWWAHYCAVTYPNNPPLQRALKSHLHYALTHHLLALSIDPALITEAKSTLLKLPPAEFAYMLMENAYQGAPDALLSDQHHVLGLNLSRATIPSLYSIQNFSYVYRHEIPRFAEAAAQDNWVLGVPDAIAGNHKNITEKMKQHYLQAYANAWQHALTQIDLQPVHSFVGIQHIISLLSTAHSPLWEMVKVITVNANLTKEAKNKHYQSAITQWLSNPLSQKIFSHTLVQLSAFMKNMSQAKNVNNAAYNVALSRILHSNKATPIDALTHLRNLPPSVQQWAHSLSIISWALVLNRSARYLNTLWQETVIPSCQTQIAPYFPINLTAPKDIALNNFNNFFSPQGTLDTFFTYYLAPFVDTSKFYWTWKTLAGQKLPIPQARLENLLRGSLIKQMFYVKGSSIPHIAFSLSYKSMPSQVRSVTLNFGGQQATFTHATHNNFAVNWPGPQPGFATIQFNLQRAGHPNRTFSGPFAWLKLLHSGKLAATNTPNTFLLSFSTPSGKVTLLLRAKQLINPFVPGILGRFRCHDL